MKAIAIIPESKTVRTIDIPEPSIVETDEIKIKVLRVGICGTDREEVAGGRALAPKGRNELIIGHEMLGQVVEVGKEVRRIKPGDFTVLTVRRGCGTCLPCIMNRSDMCTTGNFTERGIWKQDGYEAEYVVDKEQYAVHIPAELEPIGVLTEPMSIVEKAIDEAVRIQTIRLPDAPATPHWLFGRRCLVAGLGPVGLLGALALRLRGAEVYGLDIVDENSSRPKWLSSIGGHYIDGRKIPADHVDEAIGFMDLILEAAGITRLDFDLFDSLATNGIYILTGIPDGDRLIQVSGARLMRTLVLKNQIMVGSVNASRDHFQMAVNDLAVANAKWGNLVRELITHRYFYTDFMKVFSAHSSDEIKAVIEWTKG
ncbi:MAG: glucose 1-dehydrogenase [Bacteroidota bacterium]|nr:glucose 1-dehydrogenase [Bacteroidota bacterium]